MAIRFGSYGDKIWFFRSEDMAAFLGIDRWRDNQTLMNSPFLPCLYAVRGVSGGVADRGQDRTFVIFRPFGRVSVLLVE